MKFQNRARYFKKYTLFAYTVSYNDHFTTVFNFKLNQKKNSLFILDRCDVSIFNHSNKQQSSIFLSTLTMGEPAHHTPSREKGLLNPRDCGGVGKTRMG
jgi:hypothetical protein